MCTHTCNKQNLSQVTLIGQQYVIFSTSIIQYELYDHQDQLGRQVSIFSMPSFRNTTISQYKYKQEVITIKTLTHKRTRFKTSNNLINYNISSRSSFCSIT